MMSKMVLQISTSLLKRTKLNSSNVTERLEPPSIDCPCWKERVANSTSVLLKPYIYPP